MTFTLHTDRPADLAAGSVSYEVLHIAAPEHRDLPTSVETRMTVP